MLDQQHKRALESEIILDDATRGKCFGNKLNTVIVTIGLVAVFPT